MRKLLQWLCDFKVLLITFALVISALYGCWYFLHGDKERGTFGDMFGSVNALFSGLTLAAVIYGVFQQRNELEKQEKALQEQRVFMQKQLEHMRRNEIDSQFFHLWQHYEKSIENIHMYNKLGREGLLEFIEDVIEFNNPEVRKKGGGVSYFSQMEPHYFQEHVKSFIERNQFSLGHVFRSLYQLLRYVDQHTALNFERKRQYINFIKNNISANELIVLFYMVVADGTHPNFKNLIEKYHFFEFLQEGRDSKKFLADSWIVHFFKPSAFNPDV